MKNLQSVFSAYGFDLNSAQVMQFEKYFNILIETNKVMNLTAITEEQDVLFKHFLDSILPSKILPLNARVVDVGSGAGFPAIPLKIVRPDLKIVMVDSLQKRVNFLNSVIEELGLTNAKAVHSRAEDFARENREKFDVSVARAVAPLNTLCEYLLPLTAVGGMSIIYKSTKLEEELLTAENAIKILGAKIKEIKEYSINQIDAVRKILVLEKILQTPKKYPRAKNLPKQSPII